jgi:uncharacterized protein YecE (DUF72 family)
MIRVGISGWNYDGWRGVFYPKGLSQKKELSFATREFSTIEVNGTFYSLQRPTTFQHWYETAPENFIYSLKGPRFITHIKQLKEPEKPLANFFASGVLLLREKLGPIIWQLPPHFHYNKEKLENFFSQLPRTTKEAARLSKKHDHFLDDREYTKALVNIPLRYALEIRHESFDNNPEFLKLLRKHEITLIFADTAGIWPYIEKITSDFLYLRLHGSKHLYVTGYGDKVLDQWAAKIKRWQGRARRDVYVYFDNDVKVRAPYDAYRLSQRLTDFEAEVPIPKPRLKGLKKIFGPRAAAADPKDKRWDFSRTPKESR